MKAVLDTNVFISAVFFGGTPGEVLSAWREGAFQIVLSREIVYEYRRVGMRLAATFPAVDLGPALNLLLSHAEFVIPAALTQTFCRDPDDDKFVACAIAAKPPIW